MPLRMLPSNTPNGCASISLTCRSRRATPRTAPAVPFCGPRSDHSVLLALELERACGLKMAAAKAAERMPQLRFAAEAGPNCFLRFWLSWEPSCARRTRCVARAFCPEFFHHAELPCGLMGPPEEDARPLAEKMESGGRLEVRLLHQEAGEEVLLAKGTLPLAPLLRRDGPWRLTLPLLAPEGGEAVGGLELGIGFAGGAAERRRVLEAGREAGFGPAAEALGAQEAEEAGEEPWSAGGKHVLG